MSALPRVLFIVGFPRSGSTLLGRLLHEIDGVFFAGELAHLWSLLDRRSQILCGCGAKLLQCPRWAEILDRCAVPSDRALELQRRARRSVGGGRLPRRESERTAAAEYVEICARLDRAIQAAVDADLIVDSSKLTTDALLGALVPGVSTQFVHLVRDPRGAVFSRQRNRDLRLAERRHPRPWLARRRKLLLVADSLLWLRSNRVAEGRVAGMDCPYRRLRYEDLVADPRRAVAELARGAGLEPGPMAFLEGSRAVLGINHSISGNRNRTERGEVEVAPDLAWQGGLSALESRWITALTRPVARAYGYV